MSGFVYVLSNPSMPGIVKIARTERLPDQRAKELQTTGVPQPFQIEFAGWCEDVHEAEQLAHEELEKYRVSDSREFFAVEAYIAVQRVVSVVASQAGYGFDVRLWEMSVDEADIHLVAHQHDIHPFCVSQLFQHVSHDGWAEAIARQKLIHEQRELRKIRK